ncbi:MAG: D-alanyl-D-alanine carboxypeptidase [Clostridiales bacterium]|nr:D-alanyl-D-alanine carboxypeptidase [Clostridiales bacterium]
MLRNLLILFLGLCLVFSSVPALGTEIDLSPTPVPEPAEAALCPLSDTPLLEHPPFNASCASMMLLEMDSGQIIFQSNPDTPRSVASVTKVMTILLALEMLETGRLSADTVVTISEDAAGMGGSQVLLDVGEKQTVGVLLKSAIVGSANDAAVALAEVMYGSEKICADRMNERAAALGMTDTHFVNCTGLPAAGQHTTAHDVAIMAREMFSHSLYYEYAGIWLDEVDHGDGRITQLTNTNKLIRLYDGCDGGKTGSTNEAGYCIAATAKRGDMRLIAVVLGADTGKERFAIASEMFDYGFANYRRYPVARKGTRIKGLLPVTGGASEGVPLMLDGDLTLLVLKGSEQSIQLSPSLPQSLAAPVASGQPVGHVAVNIENRTVAQIPVVTCESVDAKGLMPGLRRVIGQWVA